MQKLKSYFIIIFISDFGLNLKGHTNKCTAKGIDFK